MVGADLSSKLRRWRRSNGVKQSTLAEILSVSQAAVSRWENGVDHPTVGLLRKITDLISDGIHDELTIDRRFIQRLSSVEAIFDFDGIRLEATSAGLNRVWPDFARLIGQPVAHRMIGESRIVLDDSSLRKAIIGGDVAIVAGITTRHTDIELDSAAKHRWIARIRKHGARVFTTMVYEPCDPDAALGIEEIFHVDDVLAR